MVTKQKKKYTELARDPGKTTNDSRLPLEPSQQMPTHRGAAEGIKWPPPPRIVGLAGEARATRIPDPTYMDVLKRSPLHHERVVDPREQGYRIVGVQQVKKFAITYWRDGVLEHRVMEATSADEAALLLDKEIETEEQNHG